VEFEGDVRARGAPGGPVDQVEDGNDKLFGGFGDDTIVDGPGTDLNDGELGADTVDYSYRSASVHVDLEGDADDGPAGEHDTVLPSIEHIVGGKSNDTLIGDGRPNFIDGRGENDTVYGGGGNDTLVGGAGQDKLYGQDGNDFLDTRDGITDLVLDGGAGTDTAKKDSSDPRTSIEVLFNG
jgi:Ca2+-binding RTX toxin-like protein